MRRFGSRLRPFLKGSICQLCYLSDILLILIVDKVGDIAILQHLDELLGRVNLVVFNVSGLLRVR